MLTRNYWYEEVIVSTRKSELENKTSCFSSEKLSWLSFFARSYSVAEGESSQCERPPRAILADQKVKVVSLFLKFRGHYRCAFQHATFRARYTMRVIHNTYFHTTSNFLEPRLIDMSSNNVWLPVFPVAIL